MIKNENENKVRLILYTVGVLTRRDVVLTCEGPWKMVNRMAYGNEGDEDK